MANNPNRGLTKHVVLFIGHRLRLRHDDTSTSVNSGRFKVLHVAYCHIVVVYIPYKLVFNFLLTKCTFFNKNLRACGQSFLRYSHGGALRSCRCHFSIYRELMRNESLGVNQSSSLLLRPHQSSLQCKTRQYVQ